MVSGFVFKGGRQLYVLRTPFQNMTDSAICKLFAPAKQESVQRTHLQAEFLMKKNHDYLICIAHIPKLHSAIRRDIWDEERKNKGDFN